MFIINKLTENVEGRASHAVGLVGSGMWVVGGTVLHVRRQLNDLLRYDSF